MTLNIKHLINELRFTFVRSSGPGGQNVNKVNSKAVLKWIPSLSKVLNEDALLRFLDEYKNKINLKNEVVISSDKFRDQKQNQADCIEKLKIMIESILYPPKLRKKSKPSYSTKQKNKNLKSKHSFKKQARRKTFSID